MHQVVQPKSNPKIIYSTPWITRVLRMTLLPVILFVAVIVRLPHLNGSFWLDEAAQALESSRPLAVQYQIRDDFQPPLFHYLVHFETLVSKREDVLRLVSLTSGVVSIWVLHEIMRRISGDQVALVASLFLALNPFALFYSQELRPYALAMVCACLSWYQLLKILKSSKEQKLKKVSCSWFIAATVGGLYTMYLYPFILLSQILYVVFEHRSDTRRIICASVVACIFFLPWLPFFFGQLRAGTKLAVDLPGWSQAVATPQLKALPLTLAKFMVGQVELKDSHIYFGLAGFGVVLACVAVVETWKQKRLRFFVYWLLVPLLGAWLISFIVPVIQPKRVMMVLPAVLAMVAILATRRDRWLPVRSIAGVVLLLIFVASIRLYESHPAYQREDWRGVIAQIQTLSVDRTSVSVFAFPESFAPWRWYGHGPVMTVVTGSLRVNTVDQLQAPFRSLSGTSRIFVFDYLRDLSDPHHSIESWLHQSGYEQKGLIDGGNVGFVRVFDPQ